MRLADKAMKAGFVYNREARCWEIEFGPVFACAETILECKRLFKIHLRDTLAAYINGELAAPQRLEKAFAAINVNIQKWKEARI